MKIGSNQQFTNNMRTGSDKTGTGDASYMNITDSFKAGGKANDEVPDLREAAQRLFEGKKGREITDLWEKEQHGIAYCANDKRVIMGGYGTKVAAIDPGNRRLLWESESKGMVHEGKDGLLYVSGGRKELAALHPSTGIRVLNKEFDSEVKVLKVGDDGTVYARTGKDIVALDPDSLEIKNSCEVIGDAVINNDGMIYSGGPDAHKLRAYDFKAGKLKWETDTVGMVRCAPAVSKDGKTVYVGEVKSNSLVAYDTQSGKEKWRFDTGGGIVASPIVNEDETVIVGTVSPGSALFGVNPDTGKPMWQNRSRSDYSKEMNFGPDGTLFVPVGCFVQAFNPSTGKLLWEKKGNSAVFRGPVAGAEGKLFFGTNGKGMHCIQDHALTRFYLNQNSKNDPSKEADKNPVIEQGKGFVDIGGVKLKINK